MQLKVKDITEEQLSRINITNREWFIMSLRNGFIDKEYHTLEYVGDVFGVTRQRIRQIESKTMEKIKQL